MGLERFAQLLNMLPRGMTIVGSRSTRSHHGLRLRALSSDGSRWGHRHKAERRPAAGTRKAGHLLSWSLAPSSDPTRPLAYLPTCGKRCWHASAEPQPVLASEEVLALVEERQAARSWRDWERRRWPAPPHRDPRLAGARHRKDRCSSRFSADGRV
jgi:hypothetical protein